MRLALAGAIAILVLDQERAMIFEVIHPAMSARRPRRVGRSSVALAQIKTRCEMRQVGTTEVESMPDLDCDWIDEGSPEGHWRNKLKVELVRHGGSTYRSVKHFSGYAGYTSVTDHALRSYLLSGDGFQATRACDRAFEGSPVRDFVGVLGMHGHPEHGRGLDRPGAGDEDDAEAASAAASAFLRDDFLLVGHDLYRRYAPMLMGIGSLVDDVEGFVTLTLNRTRMPEEGFLYGWGRVDEARASIHAPDALLTAYAERAPDPDGTLGNADVVRSISIMAAMLARDLASAGRNARVNGRPLDEVTEAEAGLAPIHFLGRTGRLPEGDLRSAIPRIEVAIDAVHRHAKGCVRRERRRCNMLGYLEGCARPRLAHHPEIPEEDALAIRML